MFDKELSDLTTAEYKYGFVTEVQEEKAPIGLTEDTVKWISHKKQEPDWMLAWRLKAFAHFLKLLEKDRIPKWANVKFHPIDFHTKIPLIHWLPRNYHRLILRIIGLDYFSKEGIDLFQIRKGPNNRFTHNEVLDQYLNAIAML